jgi:hypothetical protein
LTKLSNGCWNCQYRRGLSCDFKGALPDDWMKLALINMERPINEKQLKIPLNDKDRDVEADEWGLLFGEHCSELTPKETKEKVSFT